MAATTPVPLSKKSQNIFIEYYRAVQDSSTSMLEDQRCRMEEIDREYQREVIYNQAHLDAKAANKAGDTTRKQDIVVPVVMPQVETAADYQASVFLTGEPLFGVVADPAYMDQALQMEALLEEQSLRGKWTRSLSLSFRDGFKYNFAPIEIDWHRETSYAIETDLERSKEEGMPKKLIWAGNRLQRLDPYNVFVDDQVNPTEVYQYGDYAGYTEYYSRIRLKQLIAELPSVIVGNVIPAFESGPPGNSGAKAQGAFGFYEPDINREHGSEQTTELDWGAWAGLSSTAKDIRYQNGYEVTRLYARVLPSEFNLKVPNSNTPQIYKLIIVNHQHIIYAERQTNAHNMIPILIGQPLEDGLAYQTKALAENSVPFQQVTTSYMTSIMESRRRAISDRTLYDRTRVSAADINTPNPTANIPVKPSAFGGKLQEAVYPFPYRESEQGNNMQQISTLLQMSNQLAGQNAAKQGQFVKGNKTRHEYADVMNNANSRDQVVSILLEAQLFTPMKMILKTNILQYQGGTTVYSPSQKRNVNIDPVALRQAILNFRITDGLIPADKVISAEAYATAIQVVGSSPQLAGQYNLGPMFSYLTKTQGADLSAFEKSQEQVAYEQAVQQWQQMAAMAIDKGTAEDPAQVEQLLGPMPQPQDFNYDPSQNAPQPQQANTVTTTTPPNPGT